MDAKLKKFTKICDSDINHNSFEMKNYAVSILETSISPSIGNRENKENYNYHVPLKRVTTAVLCFAYFAIVS